MTIADVITAVSVAIAAIAFVAGINAWKREFIGKRHIELAETVLALFYEAEDAIREIRNPFSFGGEGTTRKRSENEREEESRFLDQAYVVFERYQKRDKLFAELRSMKYRVMATFGSTAGEPFDELAKVLDNIFFSAQILGKVYWPRQGRVSMDEEQSKKHLQEMQKHEAVFWNMVGGQDEISTRVRRAVEKVESLTSKAASSQAGLLERIVNPKKLVTLLFHALIGWALCAATMGIGMVTTSLENALIIHAIGAPLFFTIVSLIYFKKFNYTTPLQTALIFVGFVITVDFFVVALLINRSLAMFASLLGTWIPFALIFTSTFLTGLYTAKKP